MAPSRNAMITSTIAISTKVKPASVEFLFSVRDELIQPPKPLRSRDSSRCCKICAQEQARARPVAKGLRGLFLLSNGHLRRLSDTLYWVCFEELLRTVRAS